jgi:tryptophan synthase alpha chain
VSANRLERRLAALRAEGRRGIAPYVTAGDGGPETTLAVLRALEREGAACAELGVPFSDPIADGPKLQAAHQRALEAGTTLDGVLETLARLRRGSDGAPASDLPVVLMSYANPLLRRGWQRACEEIASAGGDALLVADLPVEEGEALLEPARRAGLCPIFFAAPTSGDERILRAAAWSRGFLYVIGRTGVTGAPTELDQGFQGFVARVRALAGELPLGVGFGIDGPEAVARAVRHADLAIVGSALAVHVHRTAGGKAELAGPAAADFLRRLSAGIPR